MSDRKRREHSLEWWHVVLLIIWIDVAQTRSEQWIAVAILALDFVFAALFALCNWAIRRLERESA